MLAGAGQAARERAHDGHAGGTQRRAGEDGDLGQRVGEPDGVVEIGERRRHGVAAGEAADPLGHAARPGGRGAGRQPHQAGAERHVVLGHAAGEDERRRRRLGRGLSRGALGAEQLERRRVHARDVVVAEHAQSESRPGRQDRARPARLGRRLGHRLLPSASASTACSRSRIVCSSANARGSSRSSCVRTATRSLSVRRARGRPAVVRRAVEQARLPRLAVMLARVAPAQVTAAGAHGVDLVQRQRLVVDADLDEQRAGVAHQLVAEDDRLVAALQPALEVADVVQQRGAAERAEHRGDAGLGRPLLVEALGVGDRGVGEARQPVEARQVGRGGVAEEVLGRAVHVDGGAHVEGAAADAVDERRAAARQLVDDEAAQRLGVADHDGRGHGGRRGGPCGRRRRVDERDVELGAGADLVERLARCG